ncbi:hypothetical protein [Lunatimonas salinarum]|uniref:hypothetical protein n=1 Tax=Lunatimonas salinarum TaxID=1774590 RepID=UPI001AE0448B|nr:hypothetical protein [Lunatimonas salinarum]
MKPIPMLLLFLLLVGNSLFAQQALSNTEEYPFLDYWPVLLLPIFGFLVYGFWKRSKKRQNP